MLGLTAPQLNFSLFILFRSLNNLSNKSKLAICSLHPCLSTIFSVNCFRVACVATERAKNRRGLSQVNKVDGPFL
jgi:hypothetical protein